MAMRLQTPEKIRTLQRKLYLKAKAEPDFRTSMSACGIFWSGVTRCRRAAPRGSLLGPCSGISACFGCAGFILAPPPPRRVPRDEASRKAGCGKSASPVVCPAKAGLFSGGQFHRGNNQEPRSLDIREEGNRISEAYRQGLPWGDGESSGCNASERAGGLESVFRRPSPQPEGEGSMDGRKLIDTAGPLRRGDSGGTMTRTDRATGEALLVPAGNRRSKVGPITGSTGKWVEDERVADGRVIALRRGNARGAKAPCC